MHNKNTLFLLFAAVLLWQNGQGSSFRVEISPSTINPLEPSSINVSCTTDASLQQEAKEIQVIEVAGKDDIPIAIVENESGVSFGGKEHKDLRAEGRINSDTGYGYLTLTFLAPKETDAGLYRCFVYYLDTVGVLKRKIDDANLTYTEPDTKTAVQYLLQKVSRLETEVKEQMKQSDSKTNAVVSAFSARHTKKSPDYEGDRIVFDQIIIKEGSGYDENNGTFTAPRSGIYVFSLFAKSERGYGYMDLDLNVNKNPVAEWSASSQNSRFSAQSSITALVILRIGDVVDVTVKSKTPSVVQIQTTDFNNMFSGYLLWETT